MAVRKSVSTVKLVKEEYDCFDVYKDGDYHTFIHISVNKKEKLYRGIFEYFFDEQKLLRYAEHKTNLHFEPTQKNYCTLFTHLLTYLDEENIEKSVDELSNIVKEVLLDEEEVEEKDGKLYIRKDKIGKIGEYIFSCILYDYYKFDCIIPKILLGTDPTIKKVVNDAREFYKSRNINHLISLAIRIKESYIEHSFYNRVLVISYFMKVDKTENALIDVLDDKIIKPIEALYFTNSKHKKMLLDLGIYERDINAILKIIGDDFGDAVELRERLINYKTKLNKLSFLSRYVIERLV